MEYANIALIDTIGRVCVHKTDRVNDSMYSVTTDLFIDKEGHALDEAIKELSTVVGISPSALLNSSKITKRKEVENFCRILRNKRIHLFVCQIMKNTSIKIDKSVGDIRFVHVDVVSNMLKENKINMNMYGKEMIKFIKQK
jgi:hypothetical protein